MMNKFLKELFFKNWTLKLISLLLAIVLWVSLIPEEKIFSEKTLSIPLEAHNIPPSIELVKKPPDRIDVVIRAPRGYIDQLTSSTVVAKLNLENASVVQEDYTLSESMISIPAGVRAEVVKITPNTVSLQLEPTKEIMLEVEPVTTGKLREGLRIEKLEVNPAQVRVRGPKSKVRDDHKIRTTPIDISDLLRTTEVEADLILPGPDLRFASPLRRVRVTIFIEEASGATAKSSKPRKK